MGCLRTAKVRHSCGGIYYLKLMLLPFDIHRVWHLGVRFLHHLQGRDFEHET